MIYLFVLDDSLTRFTTRTEQLTKCCEPLQKLRVRLGTCQIDSSPPVIFIFNTDRSMRYFCGGSCCFVLVFKRFVLFAPYVSFKFR